MEEILKLLYLYIEKGYVVDKAFVNKLVEIYTNMHQLDDYIANVNIYNQYASDDPFLKRTLGDYDSSSHDLNIFYAVIEKTVMEDQIYPLLNDKEQLIFFNAMITQTILHEMEHALQSKKLDSEKTIETDILKLTAMDSSYLYNMWSEIDTMDPSLYPSFRDYFEFRQNVYRENHQICPDERMAEYASDDMLVNVLKKFEDPDSLRILYYFELKRIKDLFDAYKIDCSPSIRYIINSKLKDKVFAWEWIDPDYFKSLQNIKALLPKEERIRLGLPIEYIEHDELHNAYLSKNKTLWEAFYGKN